VSNKISTQDRTHANSEDATYSLWSVRVSTCRTLRVSKLQKRARQRAAPHCTTSQFASLLRIPAQLVVTSSSIDLHMVPVPRDGTTSPLSCIHGAVAGPGSRACTHEPLSLSRCPVSRRRTQQPRSLNCPTECSQIPLAPPVLARSGAHEHSVGHHQRSLRAASPFGHRGSPARGSSFRPLPPFDPRVHCRRCHARRHTRFGHLCGRCARRRQRADYAPLNVELASSRAARRLARLAVLARRVLAAATAAGAPRFL
jgi:hypothetical protein